MPRTSFSDSDFRNLHGFRSEIRRFLHFSEETAREVGLEPQQHQLLLAVKAAPEGHLRVTDIASTLYIRHHSAVELVDRTIKQGLVRRERSEFDRREVNVLLTPHGEEILGQLSANHRAELRRSGPALVAALESILEAVPRMWQPPGEPPSAQAAQSRRASRISAGSARIAGVYRFR